MSEKCEHDFTFSTECRCGLDIRDYVAELQSKCDELEDALRLNKAEQDVYSEAIREFDVIDKKNHVLREAVKGIFERTIKDQGRCEEEQDCTAV